MFQTEDSIDGSLKFAARSRAVVIDNLDPESKGRIRVNHPILGDTVWIPYLNLPGMFSVPEIGDIVYIEADCGYETHPIAWGNIPKGLETELKEFPPEDFRRVNPTNRGLYTPGGHLLELDDGSSLLGTDRGFRFTGSQGTKIHVKEEPFDNSVTIETPNGTIFKIDGTTDAITAKVAFGDNWELSAANGFQVATPAAGGTSLSQKGGKIDLTSTLDATIESTAGSVLIIGATSTDLISDGTASIAASLEASIGTTAGDAKLNISGGKVALGNSAGELLDLIDQTLAALTDSALKESFVLTSVGPGKLNPAIEALLLTIKTTLALIKGSL